MDEPRQGSEENGPDAPSGEGTIPLEPSPAPVAQPKGKINRPSLLEGELTNCPSCRAALAKEAVVCTKCGFDLRVGKAADVEVGEVEVETPEYERPEYVTPTRMPARVHVIAGTLVGLGAMVLAGVRASQAGSLASIGAGLLELWTLAVHTGTGVVAVAIAARLARARHTRVDLTAARMLLALAMFELVRHVRIPGLPAWLSASLFLPVAAGLYFLAVMALFKKDKEQAGYIGAAHGLLFMLFEAGIQLALWMGQELARAPKSE